MALWPNNRTDILGFQPAILAGQLAFQETRQRLQRNLTYFANEVMAPTSSIPEGAFQGPACIVAPIVGGGMAAGTAAPIVVGDAAGNVLAGGPVSGEASVTVSQAGAMALQVTMAGDGTITVSQSGAVALTIALNGNGTATITGTGGLSMIVPFTGTAPATITGSANLKGLLSLAGDITPFTELSPQNLAAAVWGTIIEAGFGADEILRILAAHAAGSASGLEGSAPQFTGLDGATVRIAGTYSAGTRTVTELRGD